MKKKIVSILMLAGLFAGTGEAMDSETLLKNPARYPVIYATEKMRIYADMETVSAMQTMDYPSSIENVSFTLYAESFKKNADAFDFARGDLVTQIRECKVELAADRREKHYEMTTTPVAVYDAKGERLTGGGDMKLGASAKEIYYNLSRLLRLGR